MESKNTAVAPSTNELPTVRSVYFCRHAYFGVSTLFCFIRWKVGPLGVVGKLFASQFRRFRIYRPEQNQHNPTAFFELHNTAFFLRFWITGWSDFFQKPVEGVLRRAMEMWGKLTKRTTKSTMLQNLAF